MQVALFCTAVMLNKIKWFIKIFQIHATKKTLNVLFIAMNLFVIVWENLMKPRPISYQFTIFEQIMLNQATIQYSDLIFTGSIGFPSINNKSLMNL